MILRTVVLCVLATLAACFNLFNKIDISNKTGAACLDGSAPAFYLWLPDQLDTPVNKVLIYFEQTPFGWCVEEDLSTSMEECLKFITQQNLNEYASTNTWSGSFIPLTGITSPFDGGEFGMWTKIIIKSCDAGAYMGNREPIDFKKHKLHFKGSVNVEEIFKYLQTKKIIANRQEIVIAGSLNGAIAAMSYVDIFKQYTNSSVRLLIDSGLHLNEYNRKTNKSSLQNRMKMLHQLFLNSQMTPHRTCSASNKEQPWKCLFGIQLLKYIKQPIFFTQSLYDGWSIDRILGFKCAEQFASLSECQEWERQVIKQYHKNITAVLREATKKEGSGAFGIACVAHDFVKGRWNNQMFEIPMNSGNMVTNITSHWLKKKETTVYIDSVEWPANKPCARKLATPVQQHLSKE